jgi:hypothetical protein
LILPTKKGEGENRSADETHSRFRVLPVFARRVRIVELQYLAGNGEVGDLGIYFLPGIIVRDERAS